VIAEVGARGAAVAGREENRMEEPSWLSLRHGAFERDGNSVLVVRLPVLVVEHVDFEWRAW
jgi:hypothetical protein